MVRLEFNVRLYRRTAKGKSDDGLQLDREPMTGHVIQTSQVKTDVAHGRDQLTFRANAVVHYYHGRWITCVYRPGPMPSNRSKGEAELTFGYHESCTKRRQCL